MGTSIDNRTWVSFGTRVSREKFTFLTRFTGDASRWRIERIRRTIDKFFSTAFTIFIRLSCIYLFRYNSFATTIRNLPKDNNSRRSNSSFKAVRAIDHLYLPYVPLNAITVSSITKELFLVFIHSSPLSLIYRIRYCTSLLEHWTISIQYSSLFL